MSQFRKALMGLLYEERVCHALSKMPNTRLVSNLKMPSRALNKMTEIDAIWITPKVIYCLEVKRYSLRLEGNWNDYTWKSTSGAGIFHKFNPVVQNEHHIRVLRHLLRRENLPVYDFKNIIILPESTYVISDYPYIYDVNLLIEDFYRRKSKMTIDVDLVWSHLQYIKEKYRV